MVTAFTVAVYIPMSMLNKEESDEAKKGEGKKAVSSQTEFLECAECKELATWTATKKEKMD